MAKRARAESAAAGGAKDEAAPATAAGLDRWLRAVALAGVYGGLLAPVVLFEGATVYPYVFGKALFLQAAIALTFPAFLVLAARQSGLRPRRSWVAAALAVYAVALALACAFAFHRHRAFWGSQERMGGLFTLAHFFAWALMAGALLRTWPEWRRLLHWQAALGLLMALAALWDLHDPGIQRVAGLLGNAIYCATYQLFALGLLALLWVRAAGRRARAAYAACAAISLVALVAAGSRGPLLGLIAGVVASALVLAITGRRFRLLLGAGVAVALAGAAYFAVALLLAPLPQLAPFWSRHPGLTHLLLVDFDPIRRRLWSIAFAGFLDRPLLGWGPGNYEAVFDVHYLPWTLCGGPEATMQDSAHSVLFEHLATTGALGTLAFAGIWIALAASLWRAFRRGWLEARALAVLLGLAAGYLVQGLFISDSLGSWSMLFLLLALGSAAAFPELAMANLAATPALPFRPAGHSALALVALALAGLALAVRGSVLPALASHANLGSVQALERRGCGAMLERARQAFAIPTPWAEDQLTLLAVNLGAVATKDALPGCPEWRDLLAHTQAVATAAWAGRPEHFRERRMLATLLSAVGRRAHDPAPLDEAGLLFQQAIAESPRRQLLRIDYSLLLAETGRVEEGAAQLQRAADEDPEIGFALWNLGRYRWRWQGEVEAGTALMVRSVSGACRYVPRTAGEAQQLARALWLRGDAAGLRAMEEHLAELPAAERTAPLYLAVARVHEQASLLPERDRLLQLALAKDATLATRLAPFFDGRVSTLAEAERLAATAAPPP